MPSFTQHNASKVNSSCSRCVHAKSLQSCPTLCDPMDCSPPGSSLCGILQARILEWVTMLPPGDLPNPGIELVSLMSSALAGGFFTTRANWEVPCSRYQYFISVHCEIIFYYMGISFCLFIHQLMDILSCIKLFLLWLKLQTVTSYLSIILLSCCRAQVPPPGER